MVKPVRRVFAAYPENPEPTRHIVAVARYVDSPVLGNPSPSRFDYGALDQAGAVKLRESAEQIRTYERKLTKQVLAIGALLLAVKASLEHSQFGEWLATEFSDWSERAAQNYMRAAEVFEGKSETIAVLPATSIYLLSAKSTPEPVRAAVVESLQKGERPTPDAIKDMVWEAREADKRARAEAKKTPEQKAKEQKAVARQQRRNQRIDAEYEAEQQRRGAAVKEVAALIVRHMGDDLDELVELLGVAQSISQRDVRLARGDFPWEFKPGPEALFCPPHYDVPAPVPKNWESTPGGAERAAAYSAAVGKALGRPE